MTIHRVDIKVAALTDSLSEEDEDIPGSYLATVDIPEDGGPASQEDIEEKALDIFHDTYAIYVLDDFDISATVRTTSGHQRLADIETPYYGDTVCRIDEDEEGSSE